MAGKDEKIIMFMLEWAENYFRSRDVFYKSILSIERGQSSLKISFKDKTENIIALPDMISLDESVLANNTSLITLNNRKNIDYLYDNWPKLSGNPGLKIYFINPFSATDKKWIINPHVHSKICDKESLKLGIQSMFETVEPLTIDMLEHKI